MRATINHREELSVIGRLHFFVDCTVQFSEAERAVIRNRQLGDHCIQVDGEHPEFRSITGYRITIMALTFVFWLLVLLILPALVLMGIFEIHGGWWVLMCMVCIGAWFYRRYLINRFEASHEKRYISLADMLKKPKFTVYTPDAYYAGQAEKSIAMQLNELKERMIAVAPGLAEQQVYSLET